MKKFIKIFYLLFLINTYINSQNTTSQKEVSLNKLKSLLKSKIVEESKVIKELYDERNFSFIYDSSRIKSILDKNNFPQNYNFFESTNVTKVIKNQGSCGSCWTIASSTALSYRFNKQGYNLDLSPQNSLSCLNKSCQEGATAIEAIFNLVKNGTVTEQCFPYSSGNGNVKEDCPTKCKDDSEYVKYYGKNGFSTLYDLTNDNYYDIVEIIINQLINYGPVVSSIFSYRDLQALYGNNDCSNIIYSHKDDGSEKSAHAVVIVGYGYDQSKYYWLIQNSWGEDFCDNGLVKIEFGQVGVERTTFIEPYIPGNNATLEEVNINFTIDKSCKLHFNGGDSVKNSFEVFAKNSDNEDTLYYQCGTTSVNNGNENICILDENYQDFYNKQKGNYYLNNIQSLGNENKFNLENSLKFYYYGVDLIQPFFKVNMYVSENGSKFMFRYFSGVDDKRFVTKIYPHVNSTNYLKNCNRVLLKPNLLNYTYIVYCEISSDELKYFEDSKNNNESYLSYDVLCGDREIIESIVFRLDKNKYPVFRIKKFVMPNSDTIQNNVNFKLIANIEGSISNFEGESHSFIALFDLENNKQNQTYFAICEIGKPLKVMDNYEILCRFGTMGDISYNNLYLLPYYYPRDNIAPYEIIIENKIKSMIDEEPTKFIKRNSILYIKLNLSLICIILFLF